MFARVRSVFARHNLPEIIEEEFSSFYELKYVNCSFISSVVMIVALSTVFLSFIRWRTESLQKSRNLENEKIVLFVAFLRISV